jgi:hypothetical protein
MADERDRLRARLGLPPLSATTTPAPAPVTSIKDDPYYIRDPKTGLSPAQVEANKAVAEAAAAIGKPVTPGATGAQATADRVTPLTAAETREEKYFAAQAAAKGTKPTPPPADAEFTYDYVWRQDVGGPGGKWVLTKSPRRFSSTGGTGDSGSTGGTGSTGGAGSSGNAGTDALVDFQKAQAAAAQTAQRESAFAILKAEFDKYGLGSLADTVKNLIMQGSPVEEVVLKLRATPEYEKRFAGNKMRLDAGLNVYDEATYLQLENAYDQIFTSYGVTEAAGNTAEARRARYAGFIGGTISPDEVKGRVQLAVAAANEDVVTRNTLRELYPEITEKDIVSYFLNPKEALPKLETKVRSAQIGAAAVRQGLVTNVATAEELAAIGVTEQQAEQAYSAYAGMKPTLDLLSGLERDNELMVNQQVAEGALLKNLASEQRKLEMLRQKELARFSGSAGTNRGVSLSRESGGLI